MPELSLSEGVSFVGVGVSFEGVGVSLTGVAARMTLSSDDYASCLKSAATFAEALSSKDMIFTTGRS